jgi:hypothetical protein
MYHRFLTYLGDTRAPGTIRVIIPYLYLMGYNKNILANYDFLMRFDVEYFETLDILQFQRSCTKDQLEFIQNTQKIKSPRTKIFYEIDDLITKMPEYNIAYDYYLSNKQYIIEILKSVDCIVCSTFELEKHFKKYNKTIVIKNRLSEALWQQHDCINHENKKPRILWTGSRSHVNPKTGEGDFDPELIKFIKKTTNRYQWVFIGVIPPDLKSNDQIEFYPWNYCYFEYSSFIKSLKIDLAIAPLQDNDFNKCKSNLKALEYTSIGVPCVYTNITPYSFMTLKTKNTYKFIDSIEKLAEDFDFRYNIFYQDYNKLRKELYWDDKYCQQYLDSYSKILKRNISCGQL